MIPPLMAKRKSGPNKPGSSSSRPWKSKIYLDVLRETGEAALARQEAGCCYNTVINARRRTKGFRDAEEEALRAYRATIGREIHRRGVEGVDKPIYHLGQVVGWVKDYSDRLLIEHARRHIKEYREKISIDQKTQGSLTVDLADLKQLSPESRDDLERILERERDRGEEGDGDREESEE